MDRIVAILPTEIKGFGVGCEIYTNSKVYVDRRSCEIFLKHLASKRSISIKLMHTINFIYFQFYILQIVK